MKITKMGGSTLRRKEGKGHRHDLVTSTNSGDSSTCQSNFVRRAAGRLGFAGIFPALALLIVGNLLCQALTTGSALAETSYEMGNPNNVRRLVVSIGKSEVVKLDSAYGDLLVGDAGIADVVPLTT